MKFMLMTLALCAASAVFGRENPIYNGKLYTALDANNLSITNVATPTASSDVATKGYVDSHSSGLTPAEAGTIATNTVADKVAGWALKPNPAPVTDLTPAISYTTAVSNDMVTADAARYTKTEADGRYVQGEWAVDRWMVRVDEAVQANNASTASKAYTDGEGNYISSYYAPKATTLSGYGIADANIVDGTITLGSQTITPVTAYNNPGMFRYNIVASGLQSIGQVLANGDIVTTQGNGIKIGANPVVYGVSTNGTDYLHADVNLAPWGDGILSQARADSGSIATNTFAANADYQLTNATTTAFALASGQIGNYETTANITLTLDFSAAADRSGDCLLWLANTDAANEHTITILPNTLEVHGFEDGYLSAPKASTNLFMFSRVKANTIVISKREVK